MAHMVTSPHLQAAPQLAVQRMTVAAVHAPEMGEITISLMKDPYLNGNPTMGSQIVIHDKDSHGIWQAPR